MAEILITSSILILVLLLFRKLCWGKISRRLQYGLWLLVVIRLLVPAQFFTSSLSVMNVIEYAGEAAYDKWQAGQKESDTVPGDSLGDKPVTGSVQADGQLTNGTESERGGQNGTDMSVENGLQTETVGSGMVESGTLKSEIVLSGETQSQLRSQSTDIVGGKAELSGNHIYKVLLIIYIVGVVIIAGCLIVCNVRFRSKLAVDRRLIGQEGRLMVYLAAHLESPCLCGLFTPAIYMNEEGLVSEERKRHILLHEVTHYRHGDHIWTFVRSLCLVLYWFHPLVWAAAVFSTEDSELACDEGTLIRLGEEHRQAYGRTLIEMMTARTKSSQLLYCATGMINGKKEIKKRIIAIAAYKKQMMWTTVLVVLCALLLSACTAGTVVQKPDGGEVLQESEKAADGQRTEEGLKLGEGVTQNDDGSFRLSEYEVDLTEDKVKERIVFDVLYWTELDPKTGEITEEVLWEKLWSGAEIVVKILEGSEEAQDGAKQDKTLKEYSFSGVHAGNGNLAVVKYEKQNSILLYNNAMYQGVGDFRYQIWQFSPEGEIQLVKENQAEYFAPGNGENNEETVNQVLLVEEELNKLLRSSSTQILLNAAGDEEDCYLYRKYDGRSQYAFDVFMAEVGGSGLELKLKDYFYPDGMQPITRLPDNPEEWILNGGLLCMEVSQENTTAGRLDLDGDGEKEVLYLEGFSNHAGDGYNTTYPDHVHLDEHYRVRVNQAYYESYCSIADLELMAFSPDSETILLAIYDDGPSGDPLTAFYRYDGESVIPAGSIPGDLRDVTIDEDRVIHCSFRGDMIQTQWAWGYYYWDGSEIVRREDEVYYYLDESEWREREDCPLVLLQEITVYEERSESSTAMIMSPQEVQCVASDMREWVLLEAEDGTKGWIRVVQFKFPSSNSVFEVFEGLNMAD